MLFLHEIYSNGMYDNDTSGDPSMAIFVDPLRYTLPTHKKSKDLAAFQTRSVIGAQNNR